MKIEGVETTDVRKVNFAILNMPSSPDGWWSSSGQDTYQDLGVELLRHGFTAEQAVSFLEQAYSAVANEFGS